MTGDEQEAAEQQDGIFRFVVAAADVDTTKRRIIADLRDRPAMFIVQTLDEGSVELLVLFLAVSAESAATLQAMKGESWNVPPKKSAEFDNQLQFGD